MFGFGKFIIRDAAPAWRLGLGPWLLPRDFPIGGRIDYRIWRERWDKAQYSIAESIYSGAPCDEKEMSAIGSHVANDDYRPQKSAGFAPFIYAMTDEFGDGPKMDGKGMLWRLRMLLEKFEDLFPRGDEEENPEPPASGRITDDFLPLANDFYVTLKAFRVWNVNFDGALLLENLWKRVAAGWPLGEKWPLRLAMRYMLEENGVLLRWEIFSFDEEMLRRIKRDGFPSSSDFRNMMRIIDI